MPFPMLDSEEWRIVDGFGGYMVSNHGRVARILAERPNANGYPRVTLCDGDRRRDVLTHRLVLETFVGPCPGGMEGCHYPDNDPTNNHIDNLVWATRSTNNKEHKRVSGTDNRGTKHPMAKFNETDVERMFDLRECGCTLEEIANHMGASFGYVGQILRGDYWSHYAGCR
jgi:hypothetical protein